MDTQVKVVFTIEKKARFADVKALMYLVIANGMVAFYCLVHGVRCSVTMCRGTQSLLLNKPLAWVIFAGDQNTFLKIGFVTRFLQDMKHIVHQLTSDSDEHVSFHKLWLMLPLRRQWRPHRWPFSRRKGRLSSGGCGFVDCVRSSATKSGKAWLRPP